MVRINLKHSKSPNGLLIPITVNIEHLDLNHSPDGELVFVITFETGALDKNGQRIQTVIIENVERNSIKREIQRGITLIGDQIDWKNLEDDTNAPKIDYISPEPNSTDVSIDSHVVLKIRDSFPTSGIDPDSIKLKINGIDITDQLRLSGGDSEYFIRWIPTKLVN